MFDFKPVTSIFSELSWGKILQVFVFCLLLAIFILLWTSRSGIYQSLNVGSIPEKSQVIMMSQRSSTETDRVNKKLKYLGAVSIQVINVDFKKNSRTQAHLASNSQQFSTSVEDYLSSRGGSGTPVFGTHEPNNKRIIDLLNGNFICTPYSETLAPTLYLNTAAYVSYICSVPIPPYYGKFTGYINIYLSKVPSDTELSVIRQSLSELSVIIYEESISQTNKTR